MGENALGAIERSIERSIVDPGAMTDGDWSTRASSTPSTSGRTDTRWDFFEASRLDAPGHPGN
jgi:hypothetical protein